MAIAASDPTIPAQQAQLLLRLLGVFAVAALGLSFLEADQRGLLFDSDPFAFSVRDGALALDGPSVIRIGQARRDGGFPRSRTRRNRGPASRMIPRRDATPDQTGFRTGGQATDPVASDPGRISGSTGPSLPGAGSLTPVAPLAAPRLGQSIPGSGFAPSPIGFVPATPDPQPPVTVEPDPSPVVPAIPEPASWLLMIVGLGWIGFYLRRRPRPALRYA
ncbi:MAG: PEPxxWA-CTERM sorting domain-containing protein [Erythrobacter sp.]